MVYFWTCKSVILCGTDIDIIVIHRDWINCHLWLRLSGNSDKVTYKVFPRRENF